MWGELLQRLESLTNRVFALVKIGRVAAVDDTHYSQVVQVQLGNAQTVEIRKIGHYGFAYNPPENSDAVVLALNGDTRNAFVVGTEFQAPRPRNLLPGESMLWDDQGQQIYLSREGIIIQSAGKPVTLEGDLFVTGNVSDYRGTLDMLRTAFDLHAHPVPGVTAGPATVNTLPPSNPA